MVSSRKKKKLRNKHVQESIRFKTRRPRRLHFKSIATANKRRRSQVRDCIHKPETVNKNDEARNCNRAYL
ncbi:unnamed protein product [Lathyrus oleraceus]